jgi:hypothetical protein
MALIVRSVPRFQIMRLIESDVRDVVRRRKRLEALVFRRQAGKPLEQRATGGFIPLVERARLNMRLTSGDAALGTFS